MPIYLARTESGAWYKVDTDHGFWSHRGRNCDRLSRFETSVTPNPTELPWKDASQWEGATVPVVGRRMYVASRDYWRISTVITEVREIDSWEDEYEV